MDGIVIVVGGVAQPTPAEAGGKLGRVGGTLVAAEGVDAVAVRVAAAGCANSHRTAKGCAAHRVKHLTQAQGDAARLRLAAGLIGDEEGAGVGASGINAVGAATLLGAASTGEAEGVLDHIGRRAVVECKACGVAGGERTVEDDLQHFGRAVVQPARLQNLRRNAAGDFDGDVVDIGVARAS